MTLPGERALSAAHFEVLHVGSGIAPEVIRERGYWTAADWRQLDGLGFRGTQKRLECFPATVIPQYDPTGTYTHSVLRWDRPRITPGGGEIKYEQPAGVGLRLNVTPRCVPGIRDVEQSLWWTEGSKKADALASQGLVAVSTPGVDGWRSPSAIPDLFGIPLKHRRVYCAYDSDVLTKPAVRLALIALTRWMAQKGGGRLRRRLDAPPGDHGVSDRLAVDDFLAGGGTPAQLEAMAVALDPGLVGEQRDSDDPGLTKRLADAITATDHFAQDVGGQLCRYHAGVYRPKGAAYVKQRVKGLLHDWRLTARWSSHLADEVVEYLRVDAPELWERPPLAVLNVRNGLLDVATSTLQPHDPAHLSAVQLPVDYLPDATCPVWDQFVADVFPSDAHDLAFEIIAHLMCPDTSLQKAVLLLGEGGNGKSTYLRGVIAFLGREHVTSLSLHKLESDRFAVARLFGKLANVAADLPSADLAGTSVFKALTGGDIVTGEYKYRDSFEFVPFARLIFSANHPPRSADASEAFFDRWTVLPFAGRFRGTAQEIPRTVLDARLADPSELSGVLNRALAVLPGLRARGGFLESASMQAARDEFRDTTDPVAAWLDQATVTRPSAQILKGELLAAFNADAELRGLVPSSATSFGLALKRLRPEVREAQRTIAGRVQWVWLGLGLRGTTSVNGGHVPPSADGIAATPPGSRSSRGSLSVTSGGLVREPAAVVGEGGTHAGLTDMELSEPREGRGPGDEGLDFEEGTL
jgi:putative DNA primase/helicase